MPSIKVCIVNEFSYREGFNNLGDIYEIVDSETPLSGTAYEHATIIEIQNITVQQFRNKLSALRPARRVLYKLQFNNGAVEIHPGNVISPDTKDGSATVASVTIENGAWLSADAEGIIIASNLSGTWKNKSINITSPEPFQNCAVSTSEGFPYVEVNIDGKWIPKTKRPSHLYSFKNLSIADFSLLKNVLTPEEDRLSIIEKTACNDKEINDNIRIG